MRTVKITRDDIRREFRLQGIDNETIEGFVTQLDLYPVTWQQFQIAALRMAQNHVRLGSKAIWEEMRKTVRPAPKSGWTLDNSWAAYYGRAFAMKYPDLKNRIEFREVRGVKKAA